LSMTRNGLPKEKGVVRIQQGQKKGGGRIQMTNLGGKRRAVT